MWKRLRPQLPSRLRFASIGLMVCLLIGGALELLFAGIDMQRLLTDQSVRSLLFHVAPAQQSTPDHLKSGDVQITLCWHNRNDLDIWCQDPRGEVINYEHQRSASGGELDLDMNTSAGRSSDAPVENIYWPRNKAPKGHYKVYVNYYTHYASEENRTPYEGEIRVNGNLQRFKGAMRFNGKVKQLVAEFDVRPGWTLIQPGDLIAALIVGLWFGLISGLLALALIGGENAWYRRYYAKPILAMPAVSRRTGIAMMAAFGSGALAQLIFGLITNAFFPFDHAFRLPIVVLRLLLWTLLFTFLGACLSRLVPNVSRRTAPLLGLITGWCAAILFMVSAQEGNDVSARLTAAGMFGIAIGYLICLLWEEKPAPPKPQPMMTLPPMRLRPYRMTFNQIENGNRQVPESVAEKPPLVPHEKPA